MHNTSKRYTFKIQADTHEQIVAFLYDSGGRWYARTWGLAGQTYLRTYHTKPLVRAALAWRLKEVTAVCIWYIRMCKSRPPPHIDDADREGAPVEALGARGEKCAGHHQASHDVPTCGGGKEVGLHSTDVFIKYGLWEPSHLSQYDYQYTNLYYYFWSDWNVFFFSTKSSLQ